MAFSPDNVRSAKMYVCTGSVVDEELALQISHRVGLASGEKRIESYVGLVDRNSKMNGTLLAQGFEGSKEAIKVVEVVWKRYELRGVSDDMDTSPDPEFSVDEDAMEVD